MNKNKQQTNRPPALTPVIPHPQYGPGIELASILLTGLALGCALLFHLVPALFAGMMVFLLIHALAKLSLGHLSSIWSKWLALIFIVSVVTVLLLLSVLSCHAKVRYWLDCAAR